MRALDTLKTAVGVCINQNGGDPAPCNNGVDPIPTAASWVATKEAANATVASGVIELTLGAAMGTNVNGKKVKFTPTVEGQNIIWTVSSTELDGDDTAKKVKALLTANNK
ncbi:UNVERIFIED_ORG: pilin [Shinella sp. XGS7]